MKTRAEKKEEKLKTLAKLIENLQVPQTPITDFKELYLSKTKQTKNIKIISGAELKSFKKYCDEAKAIFGFDIREFLPYLHGKVTDSYISFEAEDYEIGLRLHSLFRKTVDAEFTDKKGSRKFRLYEELR